MPEMDKPADSGRPMEPQEIKPEAPGLISAQFRGHPLGQPQGRPEEKPE